MQRAYSVYCVSTLLTLTHTQSISHVPDANPSYLTHARAPAESRARAGCWGLSRIMLEVGDWGGGAGFPLGGISIRRPQRQCVIRGRVGRAHEAADCRKLRISHPTYLDICPSVICFIKNREGG